MLDYIKSFFYSSASTTVNSSVNLLDSINEGVSEGSTDQINKDLVRNSFTIKTDGEPDQAINALNQVALNVQGLVSQVFPQTFVGNGVVTYKFGLLSEDEATRVTSIENILSIHGGKAQASIK